MFKAYNIIVRCKDGKWASKALFSNMKFCDEECVEGEIKSRYYCPTIKESIQVLLDSLENMNIEVSPSCDVIYLDGDKNIYDCPKEYESAILEANKFLRSFTEKRS